MPRSQYSAFATLPGLASRLPGAAFATTSLGPGAAHDGSADALASASLARAEVAFDFARQVVEDHDKWEAEQVVQADERAQRRMAMEVATGGDSSSTPAQAKAEARPGGGGYGGREGGAAASSVRPRTNKSEPEDPQVAQQRVALVVAKTGLPSERARFFLETNSWQVEKAVAYAKEVGVVVADSEKATLHLNMPSGRDISEDFLVTQAAFDVYVKVYEQLVNKERYFKMTLRGPRGANQRTITKELDQASWSKNLSVLGVVAGGTYDVDVSQR